MSVLQNNWKDEKPRRKKMLWIFLTILAVVILPIAAVLFWITQPLISFGNTPKSEIAVSQENLKNHVRTLSEVLLQRDETRAQNLNKKADYIKQELEKTGARVSEQVFSVNGNNYRNVLALFGSPNNARIVVGAHYDTAGGLPGADDNSSGVAGLLELARLLGKANPPESIELVAYPLEEPPFFATNQMGSYHHAESLRVENAKISLMICLEMIGYFSDQPDSQNFPISQLSLFYPSKGNFIAVVGSFRNGFTTRKLKSEMQNATDLPIYSINAPASVPGVDFSDHRNYWKFGYDAVMITDTAFYRNKNYHTHQDTWEKLDYERMAKVVKGVYAAIISKSK